MESEDGKRICAGMVRSGLEVQEVILEVGEVLGELDALLGAFHKGLELGGDFDFLADDGFDGVLELGRVCGLAEDAGLAWLEKF